MGICLIAFYLDDGEVPFNYDSLFTYLEILLAGFFNMVAQNLTTIAI